MSSSPYMKIAVGREKSLAGAALLALAGSLISAEAAIAPPQPQDLTGMSLEELLHHDITPVNVLGSHTHLRDSFMFGYRYMFMQMGGNLEGTREVSNGEVLARYPVVHTGMTMEMHMAELMYAPADWMTIMAMVPYRELAMDHLLRDGSTRTDKSSGLGDVSFMGLFNVLGDSKGGGQRLVINAGFTAPTGSIDQKEEGKRFEYAMQLGSGTFDLQPGLTYLGETARIAWGAQVLGTVRLGESDHDYRLGNGYRLSAWTQLKVTDWFGPSIRLDWHAWDDIHGADPTLDPNRNPAFDATKQSGARLDFLPGLNFYVPRGLLKGNRFSLEGGVPLYQNIAGPNLGVEWIITAAWNYTFH